MYIMLNRLYAHKVIHRLCALLVRIMQMGILNVYQHPTLKLNSNKNKLGE